MGMPRMMASLKATTPLPAADLARLQWSRRLPLNCIQTTSSRLTEHSRRIRQRRLDAGDDGARLKFMRELDSGMGSGLSMSSASRLPMLGKGMMPNFMMRQNGLDMAAAHQQ